MKRLRTKAAGFSILETLVALFLTAVMLAIFSGLFNSMTQITRQSRDREEVANGVYALEEMRQELLEAVVVTSPSSSVFETSVSFQKIIPGLTDRLPPAGEEWEPFGVDHLLNVSYELEGSLLVRRTSSLSSSPQTTILARNVDGFSANLQDPNVIELRLSFKAGRVLQSYSTRVSRWTS